MWRGGLCAAGRLGCIGAFAVADAAQHCDRGCSAEPVDWGVGLREWGDASVRFLGVKPCSPCAWMDAAIAAGAWKLLKGRGGLRARILTDGVIRRGSALLHTEGASDLAAILARFAAPSSAVGVKLEVG